MLFFCPASERLRARRRARKQARRQRRALEEARAAGWKQYDDDDGEEEVEDDAEAALDNEHNTWDRPSAPPPSQQQRFLAPASDDDDSSSAGSSGSSHQDDMLPPTSSSPYKHTQTTTGTGTGTTSTPVATVISSFGGGVQVFSPQFFDTTTTTSVKEEKETTTTTPPSIDPSNSSTTATTTSSTDSPASVQQQQHTTTSRVIQNSSIQEETTAAPEEEDNNSVASSVPDTDAHSQASSLFETDDDDNEGALDNAPALHALLERLEGARREQRQDVVVGLPHPVADARSVRSSPPALSTSSLFSSTSHFQQTTTATTGTSSDDDDDDSGNHDNDEDSDDDDSFDYAAWTTKTSLNVLEPPAPSPPTLPSVVTPPTPTATDLVQLSAQSRIDADHDSSGHEGSDEDEEPHEGAEVFLIAQGNRYGGGDSASKHSGLFPIQKVEPTPTSSVTGSLASRLMGSGSVSHTFASPSPQNPTQDNTMEQQQHTVNLHDLTDAATPSGIWEELTFTPDGTYMTPNPAATTPQAARLFTAAATATTPTATNTTEPNQQPLFSPLSSMVHSIDMSLFQNNNEPRMDESFSTIESYSDVRSVASCPIAFNDEPLFRGESYAFDGVDGNSNARRLSSSFRSTQSRRVAYSLHSGKRSMTQADRLYSKALLPKRLDVSGNKDKKEYPYKNDPNTVSVLLAHVQEHVFEVVAVHVYPDTTVGDVLSQARSNATDPVLAAQTYTSLCVGRHEYAAPMLPLHIVAHTGRLVTAVPEHVTAQTMQAVQTVLFRNPKLRQWWKQQQPTEHTSRRRRPARPVSVEPRRTSIATTTIVEDEGDSSCCSSSSSSSDGNAPEAFKRTHNSSSSEEAETTLTHILSIASPRQCPSESFQLNQHVEL